ncbi:hypothetical protein Q8F55_004415 [Vanrija albida]|uniref:Uncharacterized protein n=1 Tax=Vanrija albida TaxID=181172 RepID=A0ABR3Q6Q7_9TREE
MPPRQPPPPTSSRKNNSRQRNLAPPITPSPTMTTAPEPPIPPLPPLPNPARSAANPAQLAGSAAEGLAALRALADAARNGTTEYPYPTTSDYPLPPLPPVPVPPRARVHRRSVAAKSARPLPDPPIPEASFLSAPGLTLPAAVAAHNERHPGLEAQLRYGRSALLVTLGARGYVWALLRTIGGEAAADVEVLAVRVFPNPDRRPPPVHALPPQGPAQVLSEHLSSLHLSVAKLLYRLPHIVDMSGHPCFLCGRLLSDADGLPVGRTGFLPASPKKAVAAEADKEAKVAGADADGKVAGADGDAKDAGADGKDKNGAEPDALLAPPVDEAGAPVPAQGQWVSWHPSCELV